MNRILTIVNISLLISVVTVSLNAEVTQLDDVLFDFRVYLAQNYDSRGGHSGSSSRGERGLTMERTFLVEGEQEQDKIHKSVELFFKKLIHKRKNTGCGSSGLKYVGVDFEEEEGILYYFDSIIYKVPEGNTIEILVLAKSVIIENEKGITQSVDYLMPPNGSIEGLEAFKKKLEKRVIILKENSLDFSREEHEIEQTKEKIAEAKFIQGE